MTRVKFVVEHSAWRQMKENYQIYLPFQFYLRDQSVVWLPTYVSDVESYSKIVDEAGRKSRIFLQHPYEIV